MKFRIAKLYDILLRRTLTMIQYIYFVKCPNCEDEPFDFFDEAKDHAMSCLSSKPVITQVEVDRNDFGECTSSSDLGTVWSWEDMMKDMPEDDAELTTFCKSETFDGGDDYFNCEFDDCLDEVPDNFCKPIAEGVPDSTRALRDSDFVIVAKHTDPNSKHGSSKYYSFLGTNLRMTKQLDKAMPYSTQAEAEHDISYAEDQLASDRYINHDQVFVASVPEARNLLNDLNWRKGTQLSFDDMTIEQLVEKMEENEDTVECKQCNELFDKKSCTKDPKLGWVCEGCGKSAITESVNTYTCWFDGKELGTVEATCEEEAYGKMEHTWPEFDYGLYDGVATVELLTEAIEQADTSAHRYEESANASSLPSETLEESDEEFYSRLTLCPECGAEQSFDHKAGACISCKFSLNEEY
jgi:hypothetical protein